MLINLLFYKPKKMASNPKIGMVQICSECNAKHVNSAETMTDKHSDSGRSLTFGNGGRFSPSDSKSQANSDSSFVRFKVIFIHTCNQKK